MNPMQMMNVNNPVMQMMQMMHSGGNPMQILQQIASQNPKAVQAINLMHGKNSKQIRTTVENMAKERGIDLKQMAQSLGINLPK
ncbi:hypothetical protein [Anaerotruncus colihominis]|uniref:hypothetical protein n=1 Tax=Anaerotruncus colihominis TaxID=169435 RepID=UPI0034A520FB